jgi:predicted anti-sigma-YlaC factor YlaD
MQCKDIQSFMIEDLYNEISSENKKILKEHLIGCKNCSSEYQELKGTVNTLKLWKDEKSESIELPIDVIKPKTTKKLFYRIAAVAASILLILSVINFRFTFNNNGLDLSFNLFGLSAETDRVAANILENGSQIEQLQLMTEMINAANDRQKQEMVILLTDFYQAIEMRRQADLKVISQGMETLRSTSNQRIEETEQNMQSLIQYTGSILDKGNYIKAIDTP